MGPSAFQTNNGERGFSYELHPLWNQLTLSVGEEDVLSTFNTGPKMSLFSRIVYLALVWVTLALSMGYIAFSLNFWEIFHNALTTFHHSFWFRHYPCLLMYYCCHRLWDCTCQFMYFPSFPSFFLSIVFVSIFCLLKTVTLSNICHLTFSSQEQTVI